ncbi:class I SAM-dependent methyltransferase [Bacillus sp. NPDC077027]|uniref:class I SAM-dependent methyltransferase n=1 Tax=Bacillus sp. NPDC077027 TaxID=3390548 RepID=UPI003CFDC0AA
MMKNLNDKKISLIIEWANRQKVLEKELNYNNDLFWRYKEMFSGNISLPSTTISPVMERLLFTISSEINIQNIVVLGSYYGYAQLFLALGLVGKKENTIVGYDLNKEACKQAELNMRTLSNDVKGNIYCMNAFEAHANHDKNSIDLLFLDVEINNSKSDYYKLLDLWLPKLKDNSLVLAHDSVVEKYKSDFNIYKYYLNKCADIKKSIDFPIDNCGLLVSRVNKESG